MTTSPPARISTGVRFGIAGVVVGILLWIVAGTFPIWVASMVPDRGWDPATNVARLWRYPEFQALFNFLWAAPLAILGLLLTAGSILGYGAYQSINNSLAAKWAAHIDQEAQLRHRQLEDRVLRAQIAGFIELAAHYWSLSLAIDGKDQFRADLPVVLSSHAQAHVRIAIQFLRKALLSVQNLLIASEDDRMSREMLRLEAQQALAYHLTTLPDTAPEECRKALEYTREAMAGKQRLDETNIPERWIEWRRSVEVGWTDSFLYARVSLRFRSALGGFSTEDFLHFDREFEAAARLYAALKEKDDLEMQPILRRYEKHLVLPPKGSRPKP